MKIGFDSDLVGGIEGRPSDRESDDERRHHRVQPRLAMRPRVTGDRKRDQREHHWQHPVGQSPVQLGAIAIGLGDVVLVRRIGIEQEWQFTVRCAKRGLAAILRQVGKVERIGGETDDRHIPRRRFPVHFAVTHDQRRALLVDRAFAGVVDQLERRVALVHYEQALENASGQAFGNLHIEAGIDLAEVLLFDDGRQQIGVSRCDHLPCAGLCLRLDHVVNEKGEGADDGRENDDRAPDDAAARAGGIDNGKLRSLFIVVSVCVMPITSAKGRTTGMIEGRMSVASLAKEPTDWPLSVTRLMRCRTCVVQIIASTGKRATRNIWPTRRNIYVSSSFMHALERSSRILAATQRNPSTLFDWLLRQARVENSFNFQFFSRCGESVSARMPAKTTKDDNHPRTTSDR